MSEELWLARDASGDVFLYTQKPRWSETLQAFGVGMGFGRFIEIPDACALGIKRGEIYRLSVSQEQATP